MARLITICLTLFTALLFHSASAQSPDLAARLNEYLTSATTKGFSGAALIARDGKVIFSHGYGLASREFDTPNTPQTKFRIGSVTKQFTAAAILLLQERGKLSLQAPLCKYLDPCPSGWGGITVQHLLTHTSGIYNYTDGREQLTRRMTPTTVMEQIDRFKDRPLEFKPGESWKYSNSNYFLLGCIIEKAAGESYESFLRKNLFIPLKLGDTGYDRQEMILKNRAEGYSQNLNGVVHARYLDMSHPYAAGALYSTVEDLFRWTEALFSGSLLSPKSLELMTTPFKDDCAHGAFVTRIFNRKLVYHNGGISGFNANLSRLPEEKITVAVLRNADFGSPSPDLIADAMIAIVLGENYELPR